MNANNVVIKNSVFLDLLKNKDNILRLYKEFLQEKAVQNVIAEDVEIIEIEEVFKGVLSNHLIFAVKENLFILIESNDSYNKNIMVVFLLYLRRALEAYLEKKYGRFYMDSPFLKVPEIHLYNLHTGKEDLGDYKISLNESMNHGITSFLNIKATVLNNEKMDTLLGQYTKFVRMIKKETKDLTRKEKEEKLENIIGYCIKENILKEYIKENRLNIVDLIMLDDH